MSRKEKSRAQAGHGFFCKEGKWNPGFSAGQGRKSTSTEVMMPHTQMEMELMAP